MEMIFFIWGLFCAVCLLFAAIVAFRVLFILKKRKAGYNKKTTCQFCNEPATDIKDNDFYLSCSHHKELARVVTERFFKENPNWTIW